MSPQELLGQVMPAPRSPESLKRTFSKGSGIDLYERYKREVQE